MFLVREGVHQCDSKHTSTGPIVSLAKLAIQAIERRLLAPGRADPPEAEDVRLGDVRRLEVRSLGDPIMERARHGAQMIVEGSDAVGAVALQGHPHLQRVAPPRAHEASDALIDDPLVVISMKQVGRLLRECRVEIALITNEQ
jgi:hypothetical protein